MYEKMVVCSVFLLEKYHSDIFAFPSNCRIILCCRTAGFSRRISDENSLIVLHQCSMTTEKKYNMEV